jgi:glycosyltransferase involved in cell wall biosynthesis
MRLGVYQDGPFGLIETDDGERLAPDPVDAPFLRFVREIGTHFDSLVLFARIHETTTPDPRLLLPATIHAVRLPDYGDLRQLWPVARTAVHTGVAFWRGLSRVDVVWTFGPHPFEFLLIALALLRRKRVVVGVRMETLAYYRARLPNRWWTPVLGLVAALDATHRLLARRVPATVVGSANVQRYTTPRGRVLPMAPSLVQAADVVSDPPDRDWTGVVDLLTVGRIDAEKNPLLLVEAISALERARPGRYRLRWAGVGPLRDDLLRHAAALGVQDRIELLGYVNHGSELLELYRGSHAFIHVSLTEGIPQVLVEAFASATPVIATDVGDVRRALDGGRGGLLVPPSDVDALTAAIIRLTDDAELRASLVAHGLVAARERTLEAEAGRVAAFLDAAEPETIRDGRRRGVSRCD